MQERRLYLDLNLLSYYYPIRDSLRADFVVQDIIQYAPVVACTARSLHGGLLKWRHLT